MNRETFHWDIPVGEQMTRMTQIALPVIKDTLAAEGKELLGYPEFLRQRPDLLVAHCCVSEQTKGRAA